MRGITRVALAGSLVAIALAGGLFWRHHMALNALPAGILHGNGRLEFTRVDVAVKYPGRVIELMAHEGDTVAAGQIMAQQDTTTAQAQYAQAEAQRARAVSAQARMQAELQARQAALRLDRDELRHAISMQARNLISDMETQRRRTAVDSTQAAVTAATQAVDEAEHAVQAAAAQVDEIHAALDELTITAPVAGRVEYRVVEPGSVLPAGGRVYALIDPVDPYMTVFFPTAQVMELKTGDQARIVFDGLPTPVAAEVSYIDSSAQFTPKYVETASEREQLVYRVKLRVTQAEQARYGRLLKAGMTGEAYIQSSPDAPWPAAIVAAGR
ncbi:MAG: HlyD family efflux transporter periplasmic adaptor subunit [Acetobacter sp.]